MRYGEQVFELTVTLDDVDLADPAAVAEAFHAAHEAQFTYALRQQEVVIANARASVTGRLPAVPPRPAAAQGAAPARSRRIYMDGWTDVPLYDFGRLAPEQVIVGPALIESATTTILIRLGDRGQISPGGWLTMTIQHQPLP